MYVRVSVRACVRACVHACVHMCMFGCVLSTACASYQNKQMPRVRGRAGKVGPLSADRLSFDIYVQKLLIVATLLSCVY